VSAQGAQPSPPAHAWWNVPGHIASTSRAGGASESGLTRLIWAQVLSFAGDAMITVALAGTAFFSAAHSQQKVNVLGYLLITMVPFALIAPLIGPALDRLSRARRAAMAATGFGRASLAALMAVNFDSVFVLFPLALGSLVLSKSYGIVRASATSRVTPTAMSLVAANSRLSVFGLGASAVGGGLMAGFLRLTQWYPAGLCAAVVIFLLAGVFALRLPRVIDTLSGSDYANSEALQESADRENTLTDQRARFRGPLATALRGESALRFAAGFLTIFLAFHIEQTSEGIAASAAFAGFVLGSGLGQLVGTVTGSRIRSTHPQRLIFGGLGLCSLTFIVPAVAFSLPIAVGCAAITSLTNSLGKVSLDSIIQQHMPRALVSRGFARSETLLQLAWVAGAGIALLLPTRQPRLAFGIAAAALIASEIFFVVHSRRHHALFGSAVAKRRRAHP
jgi:MFS family permease